MDDKGSIEVLKENLHAVNLSMNRLMYSLNICSKIGIKENYSDEEFDSFEAMTSRYARTTDMLVNKVLRSLDAVEYIDGGSVIDATHNTEKRGIANSQDLRNLKDLRNSIAHEYVTENIVRLAEKLCGTVLALPMFPELTEGDFSFVCESISEFYQK